MLICTELKSLSSVQISSCRWQIFGRTRSHHSLRSSSRITWFCRPSLAWNHVPVVCCRVVVILDYQVLQPWHGMACRREGRVIELITHAKNGSPTSIRATCLNGSIHSTPINNTRCGSSDTRWEHHEDSRVVRLYNNTVESVVAVLQRGAKTASQLTRWLWRLGRPELGQHRTHRYPWCPDRLLGVVQVT